MEHTFRSRRDACLIETTPLRQLLDDTQASSTLRIIDMRGTILPANQPKPWYIAEREAYKQGHIPGAVFVDWLEDIVDLQAEVKMTPAGPEQFSSLMGRLGISNEHQIVIYDSSGGRPAARLWWLLRYYGHDRVRLLNGGWTKWEEEGHPVSNEVNHYETTVFEVQQSPAWRTDAAQVLKSIEQESVSLMDCRSKKLYDGEVTRGEKKGHIPGAHSVPMSSLVEGPHKIWKSHDSLRQIFEDAGIKSGQKVVTYCNGGVSSSTGLFALYMTGFDDVANYAGSWFDWEKDPSHPIECSFN